MKTYMTPEEHARLHRRRARQALGLLVAVLVLVGAVTVVRAGVRTVANLFDDTQQRQEYEDKIEGLVLFDPVPFDGIENIDDLTLREAAVWGCVYSIQETQGGFDNYNTDPDTEQLLLPSVDVDAYLAKLVGPSFKMIHKSFEMDDMTVEFDETTQCYKIPVTGSVGIYRATVTRLFKKDGLLHVTVGYIPTQSADDSILNAASDTPTKYMDYLFSRQSGSWYLTGLTDSETSPKAPHRRLPLSRCRWRTARCRTPSSPQRATPLPPAKRLPGKQPPLRSQPTAPPPRAAQPLPTAPPPVKQHRRARQGKHQNRMREQHPRSGTRQTSQAGGVVHFSKISADQSLYPLAFSSHPLDLTICPSVVHQRASTPSRLSTMAWPSSSGMQNRPVVRQSATPESGASTLTPSK